MVIARIRQMVPENSSRFILVRKNLQNNASILEPRQLCWMPIERYILKLVSFKNIIHRNIDEQHLWKHSKPMKYYNKQNVKWAQTVLYKNCRIFFSRWTWQDWYGNKCNDALILSAGNFHGILPVRLGSISADKHACV